MATITNFGTLNYTIGTDTAEITSNSVSTDLNVTYSASVGKTVYETDFVPGSVLTYQVHIKNTGTGTLYSLQVVDDLGTEAYGTPLSYVDGSTSVFLHDANGTVIGPLPVRITSTDSEVTFYITGTMPEGSYLILTYDAKVDPQLGPTVVSILNSATFNAKEGGAAGTDITRTATESINRRTLSVVKTASVDTVNPGDPLSYTFTLTNVGDEIITVNSLTDQLPGNFEIANTISAVMGSTSVTFTKDTDYTVSNTNVLVLDPATGTQALQVPAATETAAGITRVVIAGTITA